MTSGCGMSRCVVIARRVHGAIRLSNITVCFEGELKDTLELQDIHVANVAIIHLAHIVRLGRTSSCTPSYRHGSTPTALPARVLLLLERHRPTKYFSEHL